MWNFLLLLIVGFICAQSGITVGPFEIDSGKSTPQSVDLTSGYCFGNYYLDLSVTRISYTGDDACVPNNVTMSIEIYDDFNNSEIITCSITSSENIISGISDIDNNETYTEQAEIVLFPGIYGECEKSYLLSELNYGIYTLYYKWNYLEMNDLGSCSGLNVGSLAVIGEISLNCSISDVIIDCESNLVWSDCASLSIPTCEELLSGTPYVYPTLCEEKCTCPSDYPYWDGEACVTKEQCLSSSTANSGEPTSQSTLQPTHAPTLIPTYGPTLRPTSRPILNRPISRPTSVPTLSIPVSAPTKKPISRPVYAPTIVPTRG